VIDMKTEEDEAFEELAKKQGDWGMQGSRKHQILRYLEDQERNDVVPNTISFHSMNPEWVMRITADRRIEVADGVDVTEAARLVLDAMQSMLDVGLEKAVLAEREACANLVDHILKEGGGTWGDAIRARGEQA
jgi:hypothetical protein